MCPALCSEHYIHYLITHNSLPVGDPDPILRKQRIKDVK